MLHLLWISFLYRNQSIKIQWFDYSRLHTLVILELTFKSVQTHIIKSGSLDASKYSCFWNTDLLFTQTGSKEDLLKSATVPLTFVLRKSPQFIFDFKWLWRIQWMSVRRYLPEIPHSQVQEKHTYVWKLNESMKMCHFIQGQLYFLPFNSC